MFPEPDSPQASHVAAARSASLSNTLAVSLRHKILILIVIFMTMSVVLALSLQKEPVFQTEARLVLEGSAFQAGVLGEFAALSQPPPAVQEIETLRSQKLARLIVADPDSQDVPEFARGGGLGLQVIVDDLDRWWPKASFMRRILGSAPPQGLLKARLAEPMGGTRGIQVVATFVAERRVRIKPVLGLDPLDEPEIDLGPNGEIKIGHTKLILTPAGNVLNRNFRITIRTERDAIESVIRGLEVRETQRGSGVIRLGYSDADPERTRQLVNAIAEMFVEYKRDRMSRRAAALVEFIGGEVERIHGELESAEAALVDFQEEEGATLLSEAGIALIERLSEVDLERARLSHRVASYQGVAEALNDPESSVVELASSVELDALGLSLVQQLLDTERRARELEIEYTDEWPELGELRDRADELRASLRNKLQANVDALAAEDASLTEIVDGYEEKLQSLPRIEREVAKLQRTAASHEAVYTLLLQQLQEAKIAQAATLEQVEIIDEAPSPRIRAIPDLRVNVVLGSGLGLLLGIALAAFRESTSRRIFNAAQLEATTGLTQFGVVPDFRRGPTRSRGGRSKNFLALRDDPDSPAAEAYRALRANLKFAAKGKKIRTLAITSAGQGEGKSTTTADLAIALAQGGARVLLVDADLRRPVVHKYFQKPVKPGLSEVLNSKTNWSEVTYDSGIENLSWIPAGSQVKNPGDLLATSSMTAIATELSESFDYVLFDVPPVLAVADAATFLHELDAIFLLCRANYMPEGVVESATRRLKLVGAPLFGCILNGYRPSRVARDYSKYGYGYGYGYGNGYGTSEKQRDSFE